MKSQHPNGIAATIALILALVFLSSASARADNIQAFDVFATDSQLVSLSDCQNGCTGNYAPGSFGGTMTIDVTTGTVESVQISVPAFLGPYSFTQFSPASTSTLFAFDTNADVAFMNLTINPGVPSFVGFKGATIVDGSAYVNAICSGHGFCGPDDPFATDIRGSILAATPLPSPLSLFAIGLALMGLIGWRTSRRSSFAAGFAAP